MIHDLVHWIVNCLGHKIDPDAYYWIHPVLHITIFWAPLAFVAAVIALAIWRRQSIRAAQALGKSRPAKRPVAALPDTPSKLVWIFTGRDQLLLVGAGLAMMPVLYITLELPKIIINSVINPPPATSFPMEHWGFQLSQADHLVILCAVYLFALLVIGAMKFVVNVYRGHVAERLLRRLRLMLLRRWNGASSGPRRIDAIPLFTQEVEPVGGYAAEAFVTPMMQGGTFLTIVVFMFVQDLVLGLAALTLLPLQMLIIPGLQRRVNRFSRQRVHELRILSGSLGDMTQGDGLHRGSTRQTTRSIKTLQSIRLHLYKSKYFMKATNNFLTSLTPFFFYSIGGYLVIQGRLSLGALIAVLAAYKDFSAPLRELFSYYELSQDVKVRYAEITRYFDGSDPASDAGVKPEVVSSTVRVIAPARPSTTCATDAQMPIRAK